MKPRPCPNNDGIAGCPIHQCYGLHDVRPRMFHLIREVDVLGVSGTGVVAEGVCFSDDRVVLNWFWSSVNEDMSHAGLAIYDNLRDCLKIHGHEGSTTIAWDDE